MDLAAGLAQGVGRRVATVPVVWTRTRTGAAVRTASRTVDQGGLRQVGETACTGRCGQHRELACPSASCPASRTDTMGTWASQPSSRLTKASSGRASARWTGRHHRDRGQRRPCSGSRPAGPPLLGVLLQEPGCRSASRWTATAAAPWPRPCRPPGQHDGPAEADGHPLVAVKKVPDERHRGQAVARLSSTGSVRLAAWRSGRVGFRPRRARFRIPGVYRFRDQRGRVIYVGKAKSLRSG